MPRKLKTPAPSPRRPTSSKGLAPKARSSGSTDEEHDSLENQIVSMATRGKLARAGRKAVAAQKKRGLPVTFQRGNQIIKEYPDGREEVLGTVAAAKYVLPKGVRVIGK